MAKDNINKSIDILSQPQHTIKKGTKLHLIRETYLYPPFKEYTLIDLPKNVKEEIITSNKNNMSMSSVETVHLTFDTIGEFTIRIKKNESVISKLMKDASDSEQKIKVSVVEEISISTNAANSFNKIKKLINQFIDN